MLGTLCTDLWACTAQLWGHHATYCEEPGETQDRHSGVNSVQSHHQPWHLEGRGWRLLRKMVETVWNVTGVIDLLYVQPYNGNLGETFIAGSVFNLEQCGILAISLRVTAETDRAPHDLGSAPDAFSLPMPLLGTQLPVVPASLWFSRTPVQAAWLCHLFLITLRRMNKLTAAYHLWGIHFKAPNRCLKPHSVISSLYILYSHQKAQFINQAQGLPVIPKNKTGRP